MVGTSSSLWAWSLGCLMTAWSTQAFITPVRPPVLHSNAALLTPRPVGPLNGAAVRGVDSFDGSFTLSTETEQLLVAYLKHPDMIKEVTKQAHCKAAEFTGELFQPVPYSPGTPLGMPKDMEKYHNNPESAPTVRDAQFVIVNVPPIIMFKAKVFKPSRLCAIYTVEGRSQEEIERLEANRKAAAGNGEKQPSSVFSMPADDKAWASMGDSLRKTVRDFQPDAQDGEDDVDLDSLIV